MPHDSSSLGLRRLVIFLVNIASLVAILHLTAGIAARHQGGVGAGLVILLFALAAPWSLMAFWNSAIGFMIARISGDAAGLTYPMLRDLGHRPVTTRTAICITIRNEAVDAVFARIRAMVTSVAAAGAAQHFGFHILSDTNRLDVAAAETKAFEALWADFPHEGFVNYRRRLDNAGFKAGNLLEFAEGAVDTYAHMIVLDADSLMSAQAMLRLVRAMEADPSLGILQTLVVGRPADNAFARIFQFGMRHAMRMHTIAVAWWQGSSGPFWGHNAIIRIRPFIEHCRLPVLSGMPPLGGHILSHDQVEAAMMRAGGYAVRVIPDEFESWEENPPSLPDFLKRDLRWGQGNVQYVRLLPMLRLNAMGRYQLVNAILMYLGAPISFLMLLTGLASAMLADHGAVAAALAFALYFVLVALIILPRLIGCLEAWLRDGALSYGGGARLLGGALIDIIFSAFVGPILMISQALFVAGLALGRRIGWEAQNRDGRHVGAIEALRSTWHQTAFALISIAILLGFAPAALPWASAILIPCLLAAPFACLTAAPWFQRRLSRYGLCAIPEDIVPVVELVPVDPVPEAAE